MSSSRACRRGGVAGQALIPALLLLAIGGVAWVGMYQVGQVAAARARLTHAADAAVYSAALAQARALNLLAYVNRAQVAHQVAVAHLVTMAAWAQFSGTQAARRALGNPPAYLITRLFGSKAGAGYTAARDVGGMANRLARQMGEHDKLVHDVLARAASNQLARAVPERDAMFEAVLRANYPEYASSSRAVRWRWLSDTWQGFVKAHDARGDTALSGMVASAAARYDFLRPRDLTRASDWIVQARCPNRRHQLRRRGATHMDAKGRWSATDTLSFHALRSNKWIGCYYREYAMGWGQAGVLADGEAIQRAPEDFSSEDFWRWVHANTDWDLFTGKRNPLADAYAFTSRITTGTRGFASYYESVSTRVDKAPRMAVEVRQQAGDAALKAPVTGRFQWPMLRDAEAITVTSAAEVFYSRVQPRADGRTELATLFRPYWQARRVAVTDAEQHRVEARQ